MDLTVNQAAYAYGGSNPSLPTSSVSSDRACEGFEGSPDHQSGSRDEQERRRPWEGRAATEAHVVSAGAESFPAHHLMNSSASGVCNV